MTGRKLNPQVSFPALAFVAVPLALIVGAAFWVAYQFVRRTRKLAMTLPGAQSRRRGLPQP